MLNRVQGNDILLNRIEQIEREKVDLQLQLHIKEEKERAKILEIQQLELQIKSLDENNIELQQSLDTFKASQSIIIAEKENLEGEVRRLTRAQEISNDNSSLWQKMTAISRELRRAEDDLKNSNKEVVDLTENNKKLESEMNLYKEKVREYEIKIDKNRLEQDNAVESILKLEILEKEHQNLCNQLTLSEISRQELFQNLSSEKEIFLIEKRSLLEEIKVLKSENIELNNRIKSSNKGLEEYDPSSAVINCNDQAKEVIELLNKKLNQSESKRRTLHNQLQELRGNIRVYVRCRPFLSSDGDEVVNSTPSVKFHPDGAGLSMVSTARGSGQSFSFDQVFSVSSTQNEVYDGISDLIQSSLDGYRVCIFSYGQTGSGKTHTMTGNFEDEGIIPRSVKHILGQSIDLRKMNGWQITLNVSIVELYNEEVRDLLSNTPVSSESQNKLKISFSQGRVSISGIKYENIPINDLESGMEKLNKLLSQSAKSRTIASTGMNDRSSRSHVLFMLEISCTHQNGTVIQGGLKLVDLAGSERLDRTGTINDAVRLKETVNINKSLSSLADVFSALSNKASHVPYRNSKLTLLLQDCLSGDGKSLMFVNISPTAASSQETLCSLRFASQVNQVELGKARKNVFLQNMPPSSQPQAPLPPSHTGSSQHMQGENGINSGAIVNNNNNNPHSPSKLARNTSRRMSMALPMPMPMSQRAAVSANSNILSSSSNKEAKTENQILCSDNQNSITMIKSRQLPVSNKRLSVMNHFPSNSNNDTAISTHSVFNISSINSAFSKKQKINNASQPISSTSNSATAKITSWR